MSTSTVPATLYSLEGLHDGSHRRSSHRHLGPKSQSQDRPYTSSALLADACESAASTQTPPLPYLPYLPVHLPSQPLVAEDRGDRLAFGILEALEFGLEGGDRDTELLMD